MNARLRIAALVAAAALGAGAARGAAAEPRPTKISYRYDSIQQLIARPVSRAFDPALGARKLSGSRRQAANVDESDQVRLPSTWWQPRLGFRDVPVAQMLAGPGPGTGPAPGPWNVVRAKTEGVSPGFQIKDARGARFAIKLDPTLHPELGSGADVVCTYLLWAAGYNVPDNSIAYFRREDLVIARDASGEDALGHKHPLDGAFLDRVLARAHRDPDGRYRAVASRFLPGKPLGEFLFEGRRKDDPEDFVPHQLRRELRGLWTVAAWINHADCSARNTLDTWVTDGGRSFVRHHLIDFSSCLGSASIEPHDLQTGHEYFLDYGVMARALATGGLAKSQWERAVDPAIPGVGVFESRAFDAGDWKPFLPNPAFDDRTERDVKWGARIVAAFTDEHLRAAVARGRYTDPRAAEYLTRVLMERRDALAERWLGGVTAGAR